MYFIFFHNFQICSHSAISLSIEKCKTLQWFFGALYDAILGAPWLNTHSAMLDFGKNIVHINGGQLQTFDFQQNVPSCQLEDRHGGPLGLGLKRGLIVIRPCML